MKDLCGCCIGLLCCDGEWIDIFCVVVLCGFVSVLLFDGFGFGDVDWVDVLVLNLCVLVLMFVICDVVFSYFVSLLSWWFYVVEVVVLVCGDVDVIYVKGLFGFEIVYLIGV